MGPIIILPQILKIYGEQEVAGLSLTTWGLHTIFLIPWIAYGILHKEKPIYIPYTIWFFAYLAMSIGILIYS